METRRQTAVYGFDLIACCSAWYCHRRFSRVWLGLLLNPPKRAPIIPISLWEETFVYVLTNHTTWIWGTNIHRKSLSAKLKSKIQLDLHFKWTVVALIHPGDAAMESNSNEDKVYYSIDYIQEEMKGKKRRENVTFTYRDDKKGIG